MFKNKSIDYIKNFVKNNLTSKKIGEKGKMTETTDEKNTVLNDEEQILNANINQEQQESDDLAGKSESLNNLKDDEIKESKSELLQKCNELNDKFLRLYSEFDNYRKRTLKEKLELNQSVTAEVIASFLPIIDDFERALDAINKEPNSDNPFKEGVDLIYSKLLNMLLQKGLEPMNCKGELFNPDFHEAIANMPAETEEMKNKIADVVAKGYLFKGKVVRYAKVLVAN